jgi:hypothetical protein
VVCHVVGRCQGITKKDILLAEGQASDLRRQFSMV